MREKIHIFTTRDKIFAYHTDTTACVELDDIALAIFHDCVDGKYKDIEKKYAHMFSRKTMCECKQQCVELLDNEIFKEPVSTYSHFKQKALRAVCLHVAHRCNLNCEYCYAGCGTFGRTKQLMSRRTMLKAVDFAFANSDGMPQLDIGFFGGEPLINFPVIRECVAYAKASAGKRNMEVTFSLTSNGTLLNKDIMAFLHREKFALIFSIDGPANIHDRMRKYPSGRRSHERILGNLLKYSNDFSKTFTVRGTFTRTTPNFSKQVIFLNDRGFRSVSVEPAQLSPEHPHAISSQSDIITIKREYATLSDIYLKRFLERRPISFFHFDYALRSILHPSPIHTQCGAGAGFISILPDGDIFPCFEAAVEARNCIGHIDTGFDRRKRVLFQKMYVDLKTKCRDCWIKYACGGGCHAFNIRYNQNIFTPYEPSCTFIKYRYMLAAWILSEISQHGKSEIDRLAMHLYKKG